MSSIPSIDGANPPMRNSGDEAGDPFVPSKPGLQMSERKRPMKTYGRQPGSAKPPWRTSETRENLQFELRFTIMKLGGLKTDLMPIKLLASRHEGFNSFLKRVKELASIPPRAKARLWRILGGLRKSARTGMVTRAQSRRPIPPVDAGDHLMIDENTFVNLRLGSQRELVDASDETANEKYNGGATIDLFGLRQDDVLVVEEIFEEEEILEQEEIFEEQKGGHSTTVGLSNLGNTCYMNSALQCIRSVEELTQYFLMDRYKKDLNPINPLSHNGDVAKAYAGLLNEMYSLNASFSFAPTNFKNIIGRCGPNFSGYGQQDSQEFLLFLIDSLQEDLSRIYLKPYIQKPDSTDEMVNNPAALREFADKCWDNYKARNDSVITDLFAGMYKSTVICPVCGKVSIIFDPFNNLTLQLPVEDVQSRTVYFMPLDSRPVTIGVEIDKNASFATLKEYVAAKVGTDPKRLIVAGICKFRIYKMFADKKSISDERFGDEDNIAVFEVEDRPSNYPPPKKNVRFNIPDSKNSHEEEDILEGYSSLADKMVVPIFHRHTKRDSHPRHTLREVFGYPAYIIITREEAKDYDAILQKILAKVDLMTTGDILEDYRRPSSEDSDVDYTASDSRIQTKSLEGEGVTKISMRDAGDLSGGSSGAPKKLSVGKHKSLPRILWPGKFIPTYLRRLFDIKYFTANQEMVPTGWETLQDESKDYPKIESRRPFNKTTHRDVNENKAQYNDSDYPEAEADPPALIRPREAIVLDWNTKAYEILFTAAETNQEGHAAPTWEKIPAISDPELEAKLRQRENQERNGMCLEDCLDEINKTEVLSEADAWYCPRCKEHRRASKKLELWKAPDILVIHLKRFNRNLLDKLEIRVDFPVEGLDLSSRVAMREEGESLTYDLFAVNNHYGGLTGGHYTAFAKNSNDNSWYEYDDSFVSRQGHPSVVVTPAAYLLFYRRRSSQLLGGVGAIHQAGGGGLELSRTAAPRMIGEDEDLENYLNTVPW